MGAGTTGGAVVGAATAGAAVGAGAAGVAVSDDPQAAATSAPMVSASAKMDLCMAVSSSVKYFNSILV